MQKYGASAFILHSAICILHSFISRFCFRQSSAKLPAMTLSVVIITFNEEANIARTLASVQELVRALDGEIIVVDSGSTDRTREIAASYGAKVFVEEWKGFAAQKNSAIEKASGDWILSLDADEALSEQLTRELELFPRAMSAVAAIHSAPSRNSRVKIAYDAEDEIARTHHVLLEEAHLRRLAKAPPVGFFVPRRNYFCGNWIRFGGFYPDKKLRLFRRERGRFENRLVHEDVVVQGPTASLSNAILHHAYPTLDVYLEHMRRYAELGAEMIRHKPRALLLLNRWLNPPLTFLYNYVVRLGFLDGREGFLLHWNHSRYVSWKYAKALELSQQTN